MIKAALVLALGLAATLALRRQSAALRHWVLAAAIGSAALMPLIAAVAPVWQLPLLPERGGRLAPALPLGDAPGTDAASANGTIRPNPSGTASLLPILRGTWAGGVGVSLLLLAIGIGRLVTVASRAHPVSDGRWAAEAAALAGRWQLKGAPAVLQTTHPSLLFTWGFRHPKVLLPRDAGSWSDDRIRMVLGHELAHIRRGDWAVQLMADAVRCAYWFDPLVWIACRRLRLESEHACDDAVLRLGVAAPEYATQLLDLARLFRRSRRSLFPAPAMARSSDLERRVRVMLNARMDRSPVSRLSGWLVVASLFALTLPIAGLSLSAAGTSHAARPQPLAPVFSVAAAPADAVAPATPPAPAGVAPRAVPPVMARENPRQGGASATCVVTTTDQFGRLVPGAVASLSNPTAGINAQGQTGQDGAFTAANIPAGDYQLTVSKPGFKTYRAGVALLAGKTIVNRVTLQLGMLSETISVSIQAGTKPGNATPGPRASHVGVAPADDPCSQTADGGCVTPPRKLADAAPVYPASAAEAGTSGTVVIEARLRIDGSVGDIQPAPDAIPEFADAAMEAIRLWQFSPARLDGVPVEVQIQVTVKFDVVRK